jgi:hypothetical protein
MQLAMMEPADRDGELVAHASSECTRLRKREVMGIRWDAAAYEARLPQHESSVVLIAQANRLAQRTDCFAVRLVLGPCRCLLPATCIHLPTNDQYMNLLRSLSVVLLPYDPARYANGQSSNIFYEALASGIPVKMSQSKSCEALG